MRAFRPPLQNPLVVMLAKVFLPVAFWWGYYDAIRIDELSRRRLENLPGKRAIFCANHSKGHDPGIIYCLRAYMHESFVYLAAREIFDRWHGLLGWLIQRIGAYSVERRAPDRQAILTTVRLLLEGKHKLVVFPEGRVSNRNDRLLAVERGLTRVFLAAAAALAATDPEAVLYLVPVGLRYRYVHDISANLSNALLRIELTLNLPNHGGGLCARFHRAQAIVMQQCKAEQEQTTKRPLPESSERLTLVKTLSTFNDDNLTQESLAWGIDLLERLLYTRVTQKGHRLVDIKIGEAIDLCAYLPAYLKDRRAAAEKLAVDLERSLLDLLELPEQPLTGKRIAIA